jgi:hypothetical protein
LAKAPNMKPVQSEEAKQITKRGVTRLTKTSKSSNGASKNLVGYQCRALGFSRTVDSYDLGSIDKFNAKLDWKDLRVVSQQIGVFSSKMDSLGAEGKMFYLSDIEGEV